MKKLLIVFTFLLVAIIVASNIVVLTISNGRCYDDVNVAPPMRIIAYYLALGDRMTPVHITMPVCRLLLSYTKRGRWT